MTAEALKFVWWGVGTLGIVGLVAFWFLAPTAAQLALQAVARFLALLLRYRIGCALLAAIVAGLVVDYKRHAYDDAQYALRTALFEEAQRRRDDDIAQKTRDAVWAEIANATAANKITDNNVKDFTNALPPSPPTGNPYLVGADACRLRHIAGQIVCEFGGGARVSKTRRSGGHSGDHAAFRLPDFVRTGAWTNKEGQ